MKIITLSVVFFFLTVTLSSAQETEIESKIGNVELKQIMNDALVDYNLLKQARGKITIIEFWETWCAPCIEGMGHLKALQAKFPNSLNVICVSSENLDKTKAFINKSDFSFDFIYDKEEKLSQIFPHQGIPHTILIDKKGHINAETLPGFIDEEVLTRLDNNIQVSLPIKKISNPSELSDEERTNSLFRFDLQRYELGDRKYIQTWARDVPVQILKGYSGKTYEDTTETITKCRIIGQNALEMYQFAYASIPKTRFIYDEDLNYLNSDLPHFLYSMSFESSSFLGDFKQNLINQLNSVWGLETQIIDREIEYYELVSIDLKEDIIMDKPNPEIPITGKTSQSFKELTTTSVLTPENLAKLLEKQIYHLQSNKYYDQEDKRIYYPVTTNLTGVYVINLSINDESSDLEKWVKILAENGLNMVKKRGMVQYVKIEKRAKNTNWSQMGEMGK